MNNNTSLNVKGSDMMEEKENKTNEEEKNQEQEKSEINEKESKNNQIKEEHEKKENDEIHSLKLKINDQKSVIDEQDDRIKRLMAEFENFKKRNNKEREGLYTSVMGDVITKLLPVIDNLEKAAQTETTDEKYKEGIVMCLNQFKDVLSACNVTEIKTVGEKFDPSLHEAVSSVVDEKLGEKVIKEEYRKGYKIGDKVIRHSLVVVAN